jgi:DNA polymerase-3 subunit delta
LKLVLKQLERHLAERLAGVYLVAGDEPLLVGRALTQIRRAARGQGFTERDLHVVERGFRWADLEAAAENLSLFSTRKIVELRLASPRPGDAGGRSIRALVEQPDPDRLLLLGINAKLDSAASRSAWVKCIEQRGVLVEVWPVDRAQLPRWIGERAAELRLELDGDAAELLADRVEGNLLAADQELRKLAMTSAGTVVDERAVLEAVADSARFDVFRLTDALVEGDAARAFAVLAGLRREGVQPVLVCWALSREITLLARLACAVDRGERLDAAFARAGVWRRRQPVLKRALARWDSARLAGLMARAASVDRVIKGGERGRPWEALTGLLLAALARRPVVRGLARAGGP